MKKCPKCNTYGENETTRFCKNCGTELFAEERYQRKNDTAINKSLPQGNQRLLFIISTFAIIFIIALLVLQREKVFIDKTKDK